MALKMKALLFQYFLEICSFWIVNIGLVTDHMAERFFPSMTFTVLIIVMDGLVIGFHQGLIIGRQLVRICH